MNIRRWLGLGMVVGALCACGGGGSSGEESPPASASYRLAGQVQKGPFAIGSSVVVSELGGGLNPTGVVYNVQTSDDLGRFEVASDIRSQRVEIIADGFFLNELTGRLSSSRMQLRALADLSVDARPTVNLLTTLQLPRLRQLVSQGLSWAQASTQSRDEVLIALGIAPARVQGLATLAGMSISGAGDADALLFALSTTLARVATNNAQANGTNDVAELTQLINTLAAQLGNAGAVGAVGLRSAFDLAATQIDLPAVRALVEAYYGARGLALSAPRFEEWIDKTGAGLVPQRMVTVAGLSFNPVSGLEPGALATTPTVSVAGLGAGVTAPVAVTGPATIIKNGIASAGAFASVQDGDTLALRMAAPGLGLRAEAVLQVGASRATWSVAGRPLSGRINGLQGSGLVLGNGGDRALIAADGAGFHFDAGVPLGGRYEITVVQQPQSPPQICAVSGGSGTVSATSVPISLDCVTAAGFALVTSQGTAETSPAVTVFSAHPQTGALAEHAKLRMSGSSLRLAVAANGQFAYALLGSSMIQALRFDRQTGQLSPIATFDTGGAADWIAVDPESKFLYVGLLGSQYRRLDIQPSGGLSAPVPVQGSGIKGFIRMAGTSAAIGVGAVVGGPGVVFSQRLDPRSGDLATPAISEGCGGSTPSLTFNPEGRFVYAVCGLDGVRVYEPDPATGRLVAGVAHLGGQQLSEGVIQPGGSLVFLKSRGERLSGSRGVASFAANASTGTLSYLEFKGMQEVPSVLALGVIESVLHVIETGQLVTYTLTPASGHLSRAYTAFPEPGVTSIHTVRR